MSSPRDQILGHGDEADGIEEYDNALPAWWLGLFYFCIAWGVLYAAHYHFIGGRSQAGAYDAEIAQADKQWPAPAASAMAALSDAPGAVEAGRAIFSANCVACHGADMHGGIGPDLTDSTWIHGGTLPEITRVITEGVPAKGMITWGPILGPQKVAQVAAFVHQSGGGVSGQPAAAPAGGAAPAAPEGGPSPAPTPGGGG